MSHPQPDPDRDVIVRPITGDSAPGHQWAVFVGAEKRAELPSEQAAMVFARLLADLVQRRVWVSPDGGDLCRIDHSHMRGCSCC